MNSHSLHPLDPLTWARQHFDAAALGDRRRVQRAVTLAAGMARQPGGSIPQLFLHRYDVKAAYTLLDRPEVTPQHLQAGHTSLVKVRLQMPGTYLLLEDSTELGWTRVHRHAPRVALITGKGLRGIAPPCQSAMIGQL